MRTSTLIAPLLLYVMWSGILAGPALRAQETSAGQDDDRSQTAAKPERLRMAPAVACRSIDGYEQYEILPGAALTAEEKLLVYYRPLHYKTVQKDEFFLAHLTQEGQVRRKGEKTVLLRKKNLMDYEAKSRQPLGPIYLRNTFALKGLPPGEYEYDIILRDEIDPSPPATQSLKFRIVAPVLPVPSKDAK
jgi:hypothetical protein